MSKICVIYHANCFDGFCAAWIAQACLPVVQETIFIPAHYGQEPPYVSPGSDLYVFDFSYSREQMLRWLTPGPRAVGSLTVLDHHKTAQASLDGLDEECAANGYIRPHIVFDMRKSGGRLVWEYFHGKDKPSPGLVDYTEDRDLWRWALPDSKAVNACLRSHPTEFDLWNRWGVLSVRQLHDLFWSEGEAILRRERQIVDDHIKHARPKVIGGYEVPCVNATVLFSEIAGRLAEGAPFGACWFDRADGKRQWSLRSCGEDGVDVAEIAKRYGGGGHKNAAGFEQEPAAITHGTVI